MPVYEFRCLQCGARFEELVEVGTGAVACRSCGAERTRRLYSAPGPPFKLVKTPAETRKQERKNAQLRQRTKQRFAAQRRTGRSGRGS